MKEKQFDFVSLLKNKMLIFKENKSANYKERTIENASADATLAFAINFHSAGEILTKKSVLDQEKIYIPITFGLEKLVISPSDIFLVADIFNRNNVKKLNIAGNGLYTLKGKYTQKEIDDFIYKFLNSLSSKLKTPITEIVSGGQTGADEAGIKAGIKMGVLTIVNAPKGWKFRNENGNDISDEELFKKRFI